MFCIAVPGPVIPFIDIKSDSSIIIQWNTSDDDAIVRYIVNIRMYVHVEPGKAKTEVVNSYPRKLPAIELNHTVDSLSKKSPVNNILIHSL